MIKEAYDSCTVSTNNRLLKPSASKTIANRMLNPNDYALVRVLCGLCYDSGQWFVKKSLERWCQEGEFFPESFGSLFKEKLVYLLMSFIKVRIAENMKIKQEFVERKQGEGLQIPVDDTFVCFLYDVENHPANCASETWLKKKLTEFLSSYDAGIRETVQKNIQQYLDHNQTLLQNLLQTWFECTNDLAKFKRFLTSQSQTRQAPVNILTSFFSCFIREREGTGPCKFTFTRAPSTEATNHSSANKKTKVIVTVESDSEDDTIDCTT